MRRRFLAVGAAATLAVSAGEACSPAPGYRVPSALELAAQADAIVIATVDGRRAAVSPEDTMVLATPTVLLKGAQLPPRVALEGELSEAVDIESEKSDRRELRAPNPEALSGGCVRLVFSRGMQIVLFLKRDVAGLLRPIRKTFARDAEDVDGAGSLWSKAVRAYAAIGAAPRARWPALLAERAAALRRMGDRDSLAIADDMDVERRRLREGG